MPDFKSGEEEFEFWSTHDSTEYVDYTNCRSWVFLWADSRRVIWPSPPIPPFRRLIWPTGNRLHHRQP
ncbi:MAG: CopG family antitoxin [bacterium]